MSEARRSALWFIGAMLLLPVLKYASTYTVPVSLAFLFPASPVRTMITRGYTAGLVWLACGLAIAFLLAFFATRVWGAPRDLWMVPAAWVFLDLAEILGYTLPFAIRGLREQDFGSLGTVISLVHPTMSGTSVVLPLLAGIAYAVVVYIACLAGCRARNREDALSEATGHA